MHIELWAAEYTPEEGGPYTDSLCLRNRVAQRQIRDGDPQNGPNLQ